MGKLTNEELCNQIKVHDCLETYTNNTYLNGESTDIMERYKGLKNSTLFDPCTGNDIDLDQTLLDACVRGDNPENALDGMDKIVPDPSFENCKNLKCVFDRLNNSENGLFCRTINNFDNEISNILNLQMGTSQTNNPDNYFELPGNTNKGAITTVNSNGEITIAFNPKLCHTTNPMTLALSILHEGIHADIWSYVKDNWNGPWPNFTESDFENNFDKLFDLLCDQSNPNLSQHQQMFENWIDDLAKGLWEFNNKQGAWEDYLYLAYQGVYNVEDPCHTQVVKFSRYQTLQKNYENNVENQFSFDECN